MPGANGRLAPGQAHPARRRRSDFTWAAADASKLQGFMNELDARCLDAFPTWLRSLAEDASELGGLLERTELPEVLRQHVAGALSYLFKSLDLIPDGIEDLGFIDDAFVLRAACRALLEAEPEAVQGCVEVDKLGKQAPLIEEFLGSDYRRLDAFVEGLRDITVRGRSVADVVGDETVRSEFLAELRAWAQTYQAPTFSRDEKNLVKLKAFLTTKLPKLDA